MGASARSPDISTILKDRMCTAVVSGDNPHGCRQADALMGLLCGKAGLETVPEHILRLMTGVRNLDNMVAAPLQDQNADPGPQLPVLLQLVHGVLNQIPDDGIDLIDGAGDLLQVVGDGYLELNAPLTCHFPE